MVDIETLCPSCMTQGSAGAPCPACGYTTDPDRNPVALPERTVVNGRFMVGRLLGKPGGWGVTYLAFDLTLETTAAIKEYLPQRIASRTPGATEVTPHGGDEVAIYEDGLAEFLDEARTLARFAHPNIVRVRDYFAENNTAYLVMDYYAGRSLSEYLRAAPGPLAADAAIALTAPVLEGLAVVHAAGYLHRDIKPANIYVTDDDTPILLDFGAARQTVGEETESLSVILTPGYAPFEQYFRKGKQGPWTDVYSVGATLYDAMSGIRPPPALDRETDDDLEPLRAVAPHVPRAVSDAVMAALARSPDGRPATAGEFRDALIGALDAPAAGADRATRVSHLLRSLAAVAGAAVIAVVAIGLLWWKHDESSDPVLATPVRAPQSIVPGDPPPRQHERPVRPRPPPEAFSACTGVAPGAACSFRAPHGIVDGTCEPIPGDAGGVQAARRPSSATAAPVVIDESNAAPAREQQRNGRSEQHERRRHRHGRKLTHDAVALVQHEHVAACTEAEPKVRAAHAAEATRGARVVDSGRADARRRADRRRARAPAARPARRRADRSRRRA